MPSAPVPPAVDRFLSEPHFAVVASLHRDGSPHTAASWYDWEDGRVLLSMDESRLRLRLIREDPRVSLTIIDRDDPYRHISLAGAVEELHDDVGLADIDRLAQRYTGAPYQSREFARVSAWVRVARWHGWDSSSSKTTHAAWSANE